MKVNGATISCSLLHLGLMRLVSLLVLYHYRKLNRSYAESFFVNAPCVL